MSNSHPPAAANDPSLLYGPEYYASHCGPVPYTRSDHWLSFFGGVADALIRAYAPRRVFDAGCAIGLLVEALWDRGVEAHGRDISAWAIEQVRADVRPWCEVGSIADPVGAEYDLVTCIEVLEHMPEAEAEAAIRAIAAAAPRVLFSSSPTDFDEPTHVNVRPPAYWLQLWAQAGFAPSVTHDAGYLAPHAYILERSETGRSERELVAFADRVRHRVALSQVGAAMHAARADLADARREADVLRDALDTAQAEATALHDALDAAQVDAAALRDALDTAQVDAARARAELATVQDAALVAQNILSTTQADLAAARTKLEARTHRSEALEASLTNATEALARHRAEAEAALRGRDADLRRATETRDAAEARARTADAAREQAEHRAWIAEAERQAVTTSTTWRATAALRRGAVLMPRPLRRLAKRAPRVLWWTATFQLPGKLRARRDAQARMRAIAASPLFDSGWYLASNPDVAISGIDPALHYATQGGPEGRDPGPYFNTRLYLQRHPEAAAEPGGAFLHAVAHDRAADGQAIAIAADIRPDPSTKLPALAAPSGQEKALLPVPDPTVPETAASEPATPEQPAPPPNPDGLLAQRFPDLAALPVFAAPASGRRRLTIVTDSVSVGSLYGGVGTALILGALAARRIGADLRLVTRTEPANGASVASVLAVHGIPWDGNIQLLHAPRDGAGDSGAQDVAASPGDLFLTTSWWTTWSTRQSVPRARIAYLLQEDERMFYPLGDDHLRCAETLSDTNLLYLVNSHLLLDHLHAEGLAPGATAFEPSFPERVYRAAPAAPGKRNFFFYARPYNVRNLYWRGLEALCAAIEEGVLDPAEWDIHFAGHGAGPLSLPRGAQPHFPGPMAWPDYAAFVRRMDVGLSLMYTPHPSYPPLDLAASGAVVVTNRFGRKRDLDRYSANIICADADVASLVSALRDATALAADTEARAANFARNCLQRDWAMSMGPALDRLAAWAEA